MSIALEIGNRKSGNLSQAQKRGRLVQDTHAYIVYRFVDGSELVFYKSSTGKVKSRDYTIYG